MTAKETDGGGWERDDDSERQLVNEGERDERTKDRGEGEMEREGEGGKRGGKGEVESERERSRRVSKLKQSGKRART